MYPNYLLRFGLATMTIKVWGKGITGGDFAAPVWRAFMLRALKDEPVKYFPAASQFGRPTF